MCDKRIDGFVSIDADQITATNIYLEEGTAVLPSLAFDLDRDTGIFSPASNAIALSTGGTKKLHVSAGRFDVILDGVYTSFTLSDTTVQNVYIMKSRLGATNLLYLDESDCLISQPLTIPSMTLDGGSILPTTENVDDIGSQAKYMKDLYSKSLNLFNATNFGTIEYETNVLAIRTNNDHSILLNPDAFPGNDGNVTLTSTETTFNKPIYASSGLEGTPSVVFSADSTTGLYRIGASNIGISTGGTKRIDISSTRNYFTNPISIGTSTTVANTNLNSANNSAESSILLSNSFQNPQNSIRIYNSNDNNTTTGTSSVQFGNKNDGASNPDATFYAGVDWNGFDGTYAIGKGNTGGVFGKPGDNDLFTVATTGFSSTAQPAFEVRSQGTSQSVVSGTSTTLTSTLFNITVVNRGFTSWSGSILTIASTGLYVLTWSVYFAGNTTGVRQMWIAYENNDGNAFGKTRHTPSADLNNWESSSWVGVLNATDVIELRVRQTSGIALSYGSGTADGRCRFSAVKLH